MHTLVRHVGFHALFIVPALLATVSNAQTNASPIGDAGEGVTLPATLSTGLFFHNGKYIPRPYVVNTDGNRVVINGRVIDISAEIRGDDEDRPSRGNPGRRRGPRNGRAGPGGPLIWQRGANEFDVGRKREISPGRSSLTERDAEKEARRIAASLSRGEHVMAFDSAPITMLGSSADRFFVADAFLSTQLTDTQRREFVGLGPAGARDNWNVWVDQLSLTPELRQQLEKDREAFLTIERREQATIAARSRLDSAAYPLTIAAMVLGVIAFGHMLQWVAQGFVIKGEESILLGAGFSSKALLLMLAMSVLDLTWTILALQAGAMSEVNPLAGQFAGSPIQLTLFKIVATGGALGILYAWRLQPKIQKATWWMCLVCILLTFRWVMFDSMMQ